MHDYAKRKLLERSAWLPYLVKPPIIIRSVIGTHYFVIKILTVPVF